MNHARRKKWGKTKLVEKAGAIGVLAFRCGLATPCTHTTYEVRVPILLETLIDALRRSYRGQRAMTLAQDWTHAQEKLADEVEQAVRQGPDAVRAEIAAFALEVLDAR